MTAPKIKICGITQSPDAILAVELGAWAIGFVFYRRSSRAIDPRVARVVRAALPSHVKVVGVFVDAPPNEIVETVETAGLDAVQLHGNETPEFCAELRFRLPRVELIKAIRVRGLQDIETFSRFETCDALLLDAFVEGIHGGSGTTFDWTVANEVRDRRSTRLIVSGGLNASNVRRASEIFRPYALDVSSGVEARPGLKDEKAMRAFFSALQEPV
jgi:phosphoribosylanthranilate isomerase